MNRVEKIWRPCEDNPKYEVSFDGEVRNKKRGNILKKKLHPSGYYTVCLSDSGLKNGKWWRLHRLVAKAFIPNPNNLPQVNHKDGNKSNNNANNLEWVTAKENIAHSFSMGLHRSGDEMPFTIIHKEQLPEIYGLRELGLSYRQISKLYGVDKTAISAAIYSKRYLKYYTEKQFREKVNKFLSKNQNKYEKRFLLNGYHTKRVIQYDKKGTIVNTFNSITDAAKANNVLKTSICNNLKGLSKFCGGYKYEYKQD